MPQYEIEIDGARYRVDSDRELTDMEAYQAVAAEHARATRGAQDGIPAGQFQQLQAKIAATADPAEKARLMAGMGEAAAAYNALPPVAQPAAPAPQPAADPTEMARLGNAQAMQTAQPTPVAPTADGVAQLSGGQYTAPAAPAIADPVALGGAGHTRGAIGPGGAPALEDVVPWQDSIGRETVYSVGGGLVGGVLGALATANPAGAFAGGTFGSALGTYFGAYDDAVAKGASPAEARDKAAGATGLDIAMSVGGGLVFKAAGKTLRLAANSGPGRALALKLGFGETAAKGKTLPAERVFTDTTTAEQAAKNAEDMAVELRRRAQAEGRGGVSEGQITGDAGWGELQARAREPGVFAAAKAADEKALQSEIAKQRDRIAGRSMDSPQARAEAGDKIQRVIDKTESAVKAKHGGVIGEASDPKGPLGGLNVRTRDVFDIVRDRLSKTSDSATHAAGEQITKDLKAQPVTAARASQLISDWNASIRELGKAGKADTREQALYVAAVQNLRQRFDDALGDAAKREGLPPGYAQRLADAKAAYREMHETLFSSTGSRIQRMAVNTPEDVLNVISQKGATTEIGEVRRIVALAGQQGDSALSQEARAALRELRAAYFQRHLSDAGDLAKLPQKMAADKDFADQFRMFFPDEATRNAIERLSAAAQIIARNPGGASNTGLVTGYGAGGGATVGAAAGALIGGPAGATVGATLGSMLGFAGADKMGRVLAHASVKPTLKVKLPQVAAWLQKAAAGGSVAAGQAIPPAVQAFLDELQEDGF